MINIFIEIQKYLVNKFKLKKKTAYRIVYYTYAIIASLPLILIGLMMHSMVFVLMAFLSSQILRKYTYGLHFTNGKCYIFTCCMFIMFSYLSKTVPLYLLIGIGLFSIKNIYIKSPLKLTVKDKDLKWHEDKILLILGIILIMSSISIFMDWNSITSGIMCSVIMVDLTLFLNKNEKG